MVVLIVLIGSFLAYRALGSLGVSFLDTWMDAARVALATLFTFTAVSHFAPMKKDLIAMVPAELPRPELLVLLAGLLELAGAAGLLLFEPTPRAQTKNS